MVQMFLVAVRNFNKQPANRIDSLGSPYDPISITHYVPRAFANSNLLTMVRRANPNQILGGLSKEDINQINRFNSCLQATATTTTATAFVTTTTTTATAVIPSTTTTSTKVGSPTAPTSVTFTNDPISQRPLLYQIKVL